MKTRKMNRRELRVLALRALFCCNVGEMDPKESFNYLLREALEEFSIEPGDTQYAWELVKTTAAELDQIDKAIDQASVRWHVSRMPKVDLSILRLAYTEAVILKSAPVEVVLNEAIELAKQFSSHASPKFVNGVLMGIFRQLGWSKGNDNHYNT